MTNPDAANIFVVSDDRAFQAHLFQALDGQGFKISAYGIAAFAALDRSGSEGCVLADAARDPPVGVAFLRQIQALRTPRLKVVLISARASVPFAVEAARAGAFEVLVLPISRDALLSCVQEAVGRLAFLPRRVASKFAPSADSAVRAHLTGRQHEILRRILEGQPNKIIAADLGISQRTTENHRAVIMRKMGAASIAHLIQIALAGRLDA